MATDFQFFSNPSSWAGPALSAGYVMKDPKTGQEVISSSPTSFVPRTVGLGGGSTSGSVNVSNINTSGGGKAALPPLPPGPAAPNLDKLKKIADKVDRKKAIEKAMAEYDELSAATESTGFQVANNAGNIYAQRMMQAGMAPLASGVVAAQARLPVYRQLAEIGTEKERTRIDAVSRADALAAQIASTIAQLQNQHASTLADFNLKSAGYQLDLNKFNASQEMAAAELALRSSALGAGGIGGGRSASGFDGGSDMGLPSSDVAAYLHAQNKGMAGFNQAAGRWQDIQAMLERMGR